MKDASHTFMNDYDEYARSFRKEMIKSYLGVKWNHSVLMRRGMLDTCEMDCIKIHWKCNFEYNYVDN